MPYCRMLLLQRHSVQSELCWPPKQTFTASKDVYVCETLLFKLNLTLDICSFLISVCQFSICGNKQLSRFIIIIVVLMYIFILQLGCLKGKNSSLLQLMYCSHADCTQNKLCVVCHYSKCNLQRKFLGN